MFGKTLTIGINGVDTSVVEVETDISNGLPGFDVTGNMSVVVKEAKERVRIALKNSGIKLGMGRITVNMSPANIRKDGTHFDLAIAISILVATGLINQEELEGTFFTGELTLEGEVIGVRGILPITIEALECGGRRIIVPKANALEGATVAGIEVIGVENLRQCIDYIKGRELISSQEYVEEPEPEEVLDFADIKGQKVLKRGMMVAAAGRHNMLIYGPPGSGKSMAARRMNGILSPLTEKESLEISKLYSIAGLLDSNTCKISKRPFRAPNYLISRSAFCGGGVVVQPGEISLAQSGVLFMDEFNLFSREVLEALRTPLETGVARIERSSYVYEYGADFLLIAAMNPCRCGYYPDRSRCNCTDFEVKKHLGKISKPILERIDIYINADRITYNDVITKEDKYTTEYMKNAVAKAVEVQRQRFTGTDISYNCAIPGNMLDTYCVLEEAARNIISQLFDKKGLSVRSYGKILKVARTIADLEGNEKITEEDLCEALGYKNMEVFDA